ncbi:prostatic acid phosphatase-like isoform X2 [Cylas formicarius]|uniref:prostatic acid phosphatase-like isoform X2 n=1 Tax=Cylas formicarius TaxID=197179 RepID=UPI002958A2B5|nr:prostatic acid phosphatase-like isoform X2 [Cylas formicarius]
MWIAAFLCAVLLSVAVSRSLPTIDDESTLHAVVVLFRHGDRAPLSSWPNDPYFSDLSLWPDGHGQLNNKGKRRHYELGQWFRERYVDWLPARYNRSDLYVRSTDVDRTLMSAASNLAGLYRPSGDQLWSDDVTWQPIPIHTIPKAEDIVLRFDVDCKKYNLLTDQLNTRDDIVTLYREKDELFRNLSLATGYDKVDIGTTSSLFSTITIYRGENLSLPAWTDQYWSEIKSLAALDFKMGTYTPELTRLRVGPFFDYLLDHLYSVKAQALTGVGDDDHPKFLMLSAHDSTVAPVADAMSVYNDAVPEFASTLLWEVRSRNEEFYLNVYFKNSTHFEELTTRDCQIDCPLDDFATAMANATVDEDTWKQECDDV